VTVKHRWENIEELLEPLPEGPAELRAKAVQDIAPLRFEFPTTDFASYRTFVNVPEVTLPVTGDDGKEYTPDIVVVDTPGNITKIVAQVETGETVNQDIAKERWAVYAGFRDVAFYLFVPVGFGGEAKKICSKLDIPVYGFRTWRYVPQGIEINDISEPPGIMPALMPPFIRRFLRGSSVK
jgi:hypothetical protein